MRPSLFAVSAACLLLASAASAQSESTASAPKERVVKLAAPGFSAVNVDEKVANFFSDHFAQRLSLEGLQVISASEIQTLIGFERSKALMGCSENSASCMAELGDALGVDGIITGSIGKFGGTFQANIKILASGNAKPLSIISRRAGSDEEMLNLLNEVAEVATDDVLQKLNVKLPEGARVRRGATRRFREKDDPAPAQSVVAAPPRAMNVLSGVGTGHIFASLVVAGGGLGLEYERLVTPSVGVFGRLNFFIGADAVDAIGGVDLGVGARWYFSGTAPQGLWVSPEVLLGIYAIIAPTYNLDVADTGIAPGINIGYTALLTHLTLSGSVGGGMYFAGGASVLDLHARVAIGYNF